MDFGDLFVEYPEVFALYEEVRQYSGQIVVQIDVIPDTMEPMQTMESNYPSIANIHTVLQFIMFTIPCLSPRFLFAMMQKHRQVVESIKKYSDLRQGWTWNLGLSYS